MRNNCYFCQKERRKEMERKDIARNGGEAGKKPTHRKHSKWHDYRERCIYHVTLVCSDRCQVLGRIVGDGVENARCELTPLGAEVSQCISSIEYFARKKGRKVRVLGKAVMPEHCHFVLFVEERMDCTVGEIVHGMKIGCNKALRREIERMRERERNGGERAASGTGYGYDGERESVGYDGEREAVGYKGEREDVGYKGGCEDVGYKGEREAVGASVGSSLGCMGKDSAYTASRNGNAADANAGYGYGHGYGYRQPPLPITSRRMLEDHAMFEEDYDETRLRRKGQLATMIRYVHNNPMHRWQKMRHRNLLIPIRGIMIGGRSYDAIGNVNLLGLARQQVWVRSRWSDQERRDYMNGCVIKARRGYALVSPFISPHEAAVRDVCLKEGHSVIQLVDNGFSDFSQCPGGLYDYCVNGQVLVLVPSEYPHLDRKKGISRAECMALNEAAKSICEEK